LKKKLLVSLGLCILSVTLTFLVALFNDFLERGVNRSPLSALNNEINDIAFQNRRLSMQDSLLNVDDIVIIEIDDASIKELGRVQLWPRSYEARVIQYLSTANPKAIAVDAIYSEPDTLSSVYANLLQSSGYDDPNKIIQALSTDRILQEALQQAGNVYLALFDDEAHSQQSLALNDLRNHVSIIATAESEVAGYTKLKNPVFPIGPLLTTAQNAGTISMPTQVDGIVRFYPVLQLLPKKGDAEKENLIGNFPFQILLDTYNIDTGCVEIRQKNIDLCGRQSIPVNEAGQFRINWLGSEESFRSISFHKVLQKDIPAGFFKNKYVFIGASAAGLYDNKTTPLTQKVPGVEVHANAFLNMANQSFLTEWNMGNALPALVVIAFFLSWIFISIRPVFSFVTMVAFSFIQLFAYWLVIFDSYSLILPIGSFILLTLTTFITGVIYRYITEERKKNMLKGAFASYVPPDIVDLVMENRHDLELGGEKKVLTVLFSDIRGFTNFSEKLDPQELVGFLNEYLDLMSEIIFHHKGTIDKFIGDAIMAIYGAPVEQTNNAERACNTAIDMMYKLKEINRRHVENEEDVLDIGIGINTGEMTVGNIGSRKRFDYTVIGDNVNLAARLEGLNKYFGTHVLVSEFTYSEIKNQPFIFRKIAAVAVKGKDKAVTVYELIDRYDKIAEYEEILEKYDKGLTNYENKNFEKAKSYFNDALKINNNDGPSEIYYDQCQNLIKNPSEFSPVFKMDIK